MKNKLTDLNDHLFAQLERLDDDDLTEEDLDKEVKRAKAMAMVGSQIIGTANVWIEAARLRNEAPGTELPEQISGVEAKPHGTLTVQERLRLAAGGRE